MVSWSRKERVYSPRMPSLKRRLRGSLMRSRTWPRMGPTKVRHNQVHNSGHADLIATVMQEWRSKLKHFLILSSAGKPIYSRHGDDQLITNYIGVVQTLISFYQEADDTLRGFTAGDVRFVVISKGPLNLVAITRLPESD